jgi:hypothetical protein
MSAPQQSAPLPKKMPIPNYSDSGSRKFLILRALITLALAHSTTLTAQQSYIVPTLIKGEVGPSRLPAGYDTAASIRFSFSSMGSIGSMAIASINGNSAIIDIPSKTITGSFIASRFDSPKVFTVSGFTIIDWQNNRTIAYRSGGNVEIGGATVARHPVDFSKISASIVNDFAAPKFTKSPASILTNIGQDVSLNWESSGDGPQRYFIYKLSSTTEQFVAYTDSPSYTFKMRAEDAGQYKVTAMIHWVSGSLKADSDVFTLSLQTTPPVIVNQPAGAVVPSGSAAQLSAVASGTLPLSYQWRKDGAAIAGATSATYSIPSASVRDAGSYTVVVSNSAGAVTSNPAALAIQSPRLSNLSVRTTLDANQLLIVGVTMSGGTKNVLLRAVGPTLSIFGVSDAMPDPKIDLFSGTTRISTNDNWGGGASLAASFQSVGAFGYSSPASRDSALVTSIDGGRTVQVSGPAGGTVLVEGYDAGNGDSPRFTNLSARNKVGTGGNILIAGFTLTGNGTRNLLIRAVGSKLAEFGVSGVLADPKLQIYRASSRISENDNWDSTLASTFASVGAFGLTTGSKDAAIITSLPAGGYTVQVSGADGGIGEALIEIYELP